MQSRHSEIRFAACMLACGDGDILITGLTKNHELSLSEVKRIISEKQDSVLFGFYLVVTENSVVFIADSVINHHPTGVEMASIAIETAKKASNMGYVPRVAFLSHSNFGSQDSKVSDDIYKAMSILGEKQVDFEYDGEMSADTALNKNLLDFYPFTMLTKPANILIMPNLHAADISSKILKKFSGEATVIGPIIVGLEKSVQIVGMDAKVSDIVNIAMLGADTI